jgi:hypothetical protein
VSKGEALLLLSVVFGLYRPTLLSGTKPRLTLREVEPSSPHDDDDNSNDDEGNDNDDNDNDNDNDNTTSTADNVSTPGPPTEA